MPTYNILNAHQVIYFTFSFIVGPIEIVLDRLTRICNICKLVCILCSRENTSSDLGINFVYKIKRLESLTSSVCPIPIVRTRIVIQEARLKPFRPHTPVNPHISYKKGTYNLTGKIPNALISITYKFLHIFLQLE